MRYTTPDTLPIYDPTDVLAPLEERLEDLATAVQTGLSARVTAADTGWVTPTMSNSSSAGTGNAAVQYRRFGGVVYMRGYWIPTANAEIQFKLPAGCRPGVTGTWWCERGGASYPTAKMEVQASSGSVIYRTSGGTGAVNYAPICFPADA